MPKALFFNVPAHGHINPSLPLVAELVRRGHEILYFASEKYRPLIEGAGATFRAYPAAVPDDFFESRGLGGDVPQKVVYELMTASQTMLPELLDIARAEQPNYVLYDGICPWGYMVAGSLKLPAVVSLSLMPLVRPPVSAMFNWEMLSMGIRLLAKDFRKGLEANRLSRALGKQYGVIPLGPMTMMSAPGDLAISYTSAYFQPYADTVNDTVRFIGRVIPETASDGTFSLEKAGGRRIVYVSLGTINNDNADFFRTCIEAFTGSDCFVVMTTGNAIRPEAFGTLPENIAIYGWVPQFDVLKRAALFVTHGGLNSVHDGLNSGVPMLLVPQTFEQTFIGQRVAELGAGLLLKKAEVNAGSLRENVARLLSDASDFKAAAARVGESLRSAGGAAKGADEIEALLKRKQN